MTRGAGQPAAAPRLAVGEPPAGPWQVWPFADVAGHLLTTAGEPGRPVVIGVDGRSAAGKTTFSERLGRRLAGSWVVHSDDIAWWHSFFDWPELMIDGVLAPVRRAEPVSYRPPPWDERQRAGAVVVPAGTAVLIVEGVGVAQRALMPYLDAVVWIQSDVAESRRRGLERDGDGAAEIAFWDEWDAAEVPFQAAQRPWERANLVVLGTTGVPHDRDAQAVVAIGPGSRAPTGSK